VSAPRLDAFFKQLCPSQAPGYAWSISSCSGRIAGGWGGSTSLDAGSADIGENTLFDLASLTKPLVTALVALRASDTGELDLLEPVNGARPEPFTLLQLLRHEAGFPPWLPLYGMVQHQDQAAPWLLSACPRSRPGLRATYSCLGYVLLGLLLQRKLGKPLDLLFSERVGIPLGLPQDAGCFNPPPRIKNRVAATERQAGNEANMARLYGAITPEFLSDPDARGVVNDGNARFMGGVSGNAGFFGCLKAVELLANAYRPERKFLSERSLDLAWRTAPGLPGEPRTAGWKADHAPGWDAGAVLPLGSIGHEGYTGTAVYLEPGSGKTYALLTNRIHPRHPGTDFGPARASFLRLAREFA